MTQTYPHLPDPDLHADFYADTASKRAVAWVIDSVLILVLTVLVIPFTAFTGIFFFPLLWLCVGLVYRIVFLAGGSATLGMRFMAVELRNHQGARFSLGEAAVHTLIYTVTISMLLPQVVSIILMLATARGQSLGDHLMGSVAINRAARH